MNAYQKNILGKNSFLFGGMYLNPTNYFTLPKSFFQNFKAIQEYKSKVCSEKEFKSLFASFDNEDVTFWLFIKPNNYDSRNKFIDYEIELLNNYNSKNFEFHILEYSKTHVTHLPKKRLQIA
jgi:hypothetical protein